MPRCLSAGQDALGTLWHREQKVCVVFNTHLAGLWGKKRDKKKVSFPGEITQLAKNVWEPAAQRPR